MFAILLTTVVALAIVFTVCVETTVATLRRAFRHQTPISPPPRTSQDGVLDYAPPASKSPMIEKRPWIAAALPALAILALWLAPSAAILYVRLVPNTWWALKIAIPLLSAVGLVILVIVLFRAVRLASDGIPAGAKWRMKPWWMAVAGMVLAYLLIVLVIDWRISAHLRQAVIDSHSALVRIKNTGPNLDVKAGAAFRAACQTIAANPDLLNWGELDPLSWEVYELYYVDPPALPEQYKSAVQLALQATAADSVDFGVDLPLVTVNSNLPHLADSRQLANLLRWHALDQARAGNWNAAMADVAAIRSLARLVGDRTNLVGMLVALGVDGLATSAIEECLPFVTSEAQLQSVPFQPQNWYPTVVAGGLEAERWISQRDIANLLLSGNFAPTPTPRKYRFLPLRLLLAQKEISVLDENYQAVSAQAKKLKRIPALPPDGLETEGFHSGSFIASLLLPSWSRSEQQGFVALYSAERLHLGIEITRYHLRHGDLPNGWDDLVRAGLIPRVPIDPWDGKLLRFVRTEDEVLIYTVGEDRRDDQGRGSRRAVSDIATRIATKPLWVLHPPKRIESPEDGAAAVP